MLVTPPEMFPVMLVGNRLLLLGELGALGLTPETHDVTCQL